MEEAPTLSPEENINGSSTKEQTRSVKGKRTKRQRPLSPIPFAIAAPAATNSSGSSGEFSPTDSAELHDNTEEEEDMANCLILLARGQSRRPAEKPPAVGEVEGVTYKYNSRRFMETSAATGGGGAKAGYYVYECKTCNRTFPSFQALGGHRASHKKPRAAMAEIDQKKNSLFVFPSDDEDQTQLMMIKNSNSNNNNNNLIPSSSLSLQLSGRTNLYGSSNKSKVHECSICGAEFTSGQALGGHMRRHRAPVGTNTALSLTTTPIAIEAEDHSQQNAQTHQKQQQQAKRTRSVLSLDLDLNLPAPEEREPKFAFVSKQQQQQQQQKQQQQQQQQPLVFSAPAMVDCHN
ncbi:hypothetical protein UlMin_026032 [Ulmus minor]